MAGLPGAPPRVAGAGRVRIWAMRRPRTGVPLLEPVARPRRRAVVVARPPAPAVRAVPRRARQPGPRDRPACGHRPCREQPDDGRPRDGRVAQHVLDRHRAEPPHRGGGGRDSFVQDQAAARRSGSSRSPATRRWSRRRPTTRRCCSTSSRSLATGRRTAIGSAILEAIDAIAEIDDSIAPSVSMGPRPRAGRRPCPRAPSRRRSSCCSPMGRATPAPSRSTRPSRPWTAGSACTPLASGRRTRAADRQAAGEPDRS